jgi:hypothetical protein
MAVLRMRVAVVKRIWRQVDFAWKSAVRFPRQ